MADRLYVVVREDLAPGAVVAQVAHAVADFCVAHPGVAGQWKHGANVVVVLGVSGQQELLQHWEKVDGPCVLVEEPDLGAKGEHTAFAVMDPPRARTRGISLAFSGRRTTVAAKPL